MRAADLGNHIGATVDLPCSRSGVLEHVVLDPAPDDPRYPRYVRGSWDDVERGYRRGWLSDDEFGVLLDLNGAGLRAAAKGESWTE